MNDMSEKSYRCPECGLAYRDSELAARCEAWCREHHSCNIEIIRQAVPESGAEE